MDTVKLKRVFAFKDKDNSITLPDPNPAFSAEEVIDFYTPEYPSLQNGIALPGEQKGDTFEIEIKNNFGNKG